MSRNGLYVVIAVLALAVVVLAYLYYEERRTTRIEIGIGEGGITLEGR